MKRQFSIKKHFQLDGSISFTFPQQFCSFLSRIIFCYTLKKRYKQLSVQAALKVIKTLYDNITKKRKSSQRHITLGTALNVTVFCDFVKQSSRRQHSFTYYIRYTSINILLAPFFRSTPQITDPRFSPRFINWSVICSAEHKLGYKEAYI